MRAVVYRFARGLVVVLLALGAQGCRGPEEIAGVRPAATPSASPRNLARVWPAPPAAPRIELLQTIKDAEDLGIEFDALESLGNLLFGAEQRTLLRPTAVITHGALIYIADAGAEGVHVFDRERSTYQLVRRAKNRPIVSPVALARAADGSVYVSDSAAAQVLRIPAGAKVATPLRLDYRPRRPTGLAVDPASGNLMIVDTGSHRVDVVSPQGRRVRSFGARGSTGGNFNYPTHLWLDARGELVVADSLNYRVQLLDGTGGQHGVMGRRGDGSGDIASLKGVALDSAGHVYAVDALFHNVQIFDRDGRFLLSFGEMGQQPGQFWLPGGIYIDPQDTIYVADAYNSRVQVFRYLGDKP